MKKFLLGGLLGAVLGAVGTVYVFQTIFVEPPMPADANTYGQFIGNVDSTWLDDGRRMRLNSDITYVDPSNKAWVAPSGSVVDGASIPTALWSVIGGPFEGKYRKASVLHDVACDAKKEPSDEVHRMFYYACRSAGVEETKAKAMYLAVLHGGPSWRLVGETRNTTGFSLAGNLESVASQIEGRTAPVDIVEEKPMTEADARAIFEFVKTNNPKLSEIKTLRLEKGKVKRAAALELKNPRLGRNNPVRPIEVKKARPVVRK